MCVMWDVSAELTLLSSGTLPPNLLSASHDPIMPREGRLDVPTPLHHVMGFKLFLAGHCGIRDDVNFINFSIFPLRLAASIP